MPIYRIEGMKKLYGGVSVHGSKNSVLPILAGTLLNAGESIIHNCPDLLDVRAATEILTGLGCRVWRDGQTVTVDSSGVTEYVISDELMRKMRSSVMFLGAIISRCKAADISYPGGCELGPRPIDLHIFALKQLGVTVKELGGRLLCSTDGIKGCDITLDFPSVGATENIMLAASKSEGQTVIINAAREPEIVDLQNFLNSMGTKITGAGSPTIKIYGVDKLKSTEYTIIPDRIVAATYLCCAAAAGGKVLIEGMIPEHISHVISVFKETGAKLTTWENAVEIEVRERLKMPSRTIQTMPYPAFPTDAQAPVMAALLKAEGTGVFSENIFKNRYRHVPELIRLGADIKVEGTVAVVRGVETLSGAEIQSPDLRGGAALIVAALSAEGTTKISRIDFIERGYENIQDILSSIGATIEREY